MSFVHDDNIGRCIDAFQKSQLVKDVENSIVLVGLKLEIPWIWDIISVVPIPAFRRFVGLFDRFEAYADTAVANTRVAAKGLTKTMFSKMAATDTQQLPEHVIRQEAVNIMIAGTDTTAMTLTYLVYAVLADETGKIRQPLLTELDAASDHATWSELEQLPYLNCVVDETLRLYSPIGGSLPRVPPAGGATLGQYHIPADTIVMTQSSSFHTDPNVIKDPYVFNPRRWESPTAEMKEYSMPFGGSARSCLGMNIARLEILHAVALLFKRCPDIRLAPSMEEDSMKPLEFFVSSPRGGKCEIVLGNNA